MKVSHGDYLAFEIPDGWVVDENDDSTSIYDNNGEGAITMSFYTVSDLQRPFDDHICIMAKKFIHAEQIKLHNPLILDTTKKSKLVLFGTGATSDDWFLKLWVVAKFPKVVMVTYHSSKKTSEVKKVDKILESLQFTL